MGVAAGAKHFRADHSMRSVPLGVDVLFLDRRGKAGPPGARFKLGLRAEQIRSAARAPVNARLVLIPVLAGERRLGALLPRYVILLRSELPLPLLVAFDDLLHARSACKPRLAPIGRPALGPRSSRAWPGYRTRAKHLNASPVQRQRARRRRANRHDGEEDIERARAIGLRRTSSENVARRLANHVGVAV